MWLYIYLTIKIKEEVIWLKGSGETERIERKRVWGGSDTNTAFTYEILKNNK